MKKKIFLPLISLILCITTLFFAGCGNTSYKTLYEYGLDMTTTMQELINDDAYAELMGYNSYNYSKFKALDYNSPIKTYKIIGPSFEEFLHLDINKTILDKWSNYSTEIKEQFKIRFSTQAIFYNIIFSSIDNIEDNIISSDCLISKIFEGYIEETIAYLYIFEKGQPIMVTFANYNNKLTANAQFVPTTKFNTLSDTRAIFNKYGCKVDNLIL